MPFVATTSATTTAPTGAIIVNGGWIDPWNGWNQTRTWSSNSTTNIWDQWQSPFATTMGTSTNVVTFGRPAAFNGQQAWQESAYAELRRADGRPAIQRTEAEWAEVREIQDIERRIRERANAAARAEAHKLLGMVLTKQQMADYAAKRYFDVVGSEGGIYRIHHGTSGNIRRLIDGQEVNRLCVHPVLYDDGGYLPTEDCLAGQALALMHDERGAVNTANVHSGVRHLRAA